MDFTIKKHIFSKKSGNLGISSETTIPGISSETTETRGQAEVKPRSSRGQVGLLQLGWVLAARLDAGLAPLAARLDAEVTSA